MTQLSAADILYYYCYCDSMAYDTIIVTDDARRTHTVVIEKSKQLSHLHGVTNKLIS